MTSQEDIERVVTRHTRALVAELIPLVQVAPVSDPEQRRRVRKMGSAADGRRLPADIEQQVLRIVDALGAAGTDGLSARKLAPLVGLTATEMHVPIQHAIRRGLVVSRGQRAGTRYHIVSR